MWCLPCPPSPLQATLAYMNGNKALAKQLGQQGRQHSDAMWDAHARASAAILAARNPGAGGGALGAVPHHVRSGAGSGGSAGRPVRGDVSSGRARQGSSGGALHVCVCVCVVG